VFVRLFLILGRANDKDEIILPDFALHESGQLITGDGMPVVQARIDAVSSQLGGKLLDPLLMGFVVPGVGDEDFRMGGHFHAIVETAAEALWPPAPLEALVSRG